MKPGYQTSEFWIAIVSQVLSFLVLTHVITPQDQGTLTASVGNAIAGVFTILASAKIVLNYIASRTTLKERHLYRQQTDSRALSAGPILPLVVTAMAAFFAGSGALAAQPVARLQASTPAQLCCLLPWRQKIEDELRNRSERGPDLGPAVIQCLQQIAENQRTIIELLRELRQHPLAAPSAPAAPAQPQVIVLGAPLQQIPLGGPPRQDIPLGGPPRQDIPLGGPPLQEIPLGGPPHQEVPLGGPPRQQIDQNHAAPPRQPIELGPKPQPLGPLTPPAGTTYRAMITRPIWRSSSWATSAALP
jgi:hypothetical protein